MKKSLLLCISMLFFLTSDVFADHLSSSLQITARMNGANEVPAVITDAQGLGVFTVSTDKKFITVDVNVNNLSGDITGIHIHEGAAGTTGDVIYNLSDFIQGTRVSTTLKNITSDEMEKFFNGSYYLNVHTAANPGGEIRAQLILESDFRYTASLSGMQEVPAVSTDAYGLGVFNLSKSGYKLQIKVVVQGLSGTITGAHLHNAAAGTNGDVVENLTTNIAGNVITAMVDPSTYIDDLKAGNIYINIHTVANPGGEVRGQLSLSGDLYFDSFLNGAQSVPAVTTLAEGVAAISISNDMQSINYDVVVDGLSGPITGIHIHEGTAGNSGEVVYNLTDNIDGNRITGTITDITIDQINKLLSGGFYLNVHTDANAGGEIRGQVYKLAREAYSYQFSGGQEVPPTTSMGSGVGMVTIDRDQTNAHFMMVLSNLGETINAAHFHNAGPGTNGDVIFNLSSFFNAFGGAYGYWTENSSTVFDASPKFRSNKVYVNVHTTTFPGGAIRANVSRSRDVFTSLPVDPLFDAKLLVASKLSGASSVPAVTTDALGVTSLMINEDRTEVEINVSVNGLSGPITGIHIHEGAPDANGDVVLNLTDFIQGNRISTTWTDFSEGQLAKLLQGNYYLNVHTTDNPGGEIRGQLRLETDATYRADLDGAQEVPATNSAAVGLATFNYTNVLNTLEVNVLVNGLSGPITGVHLHNAAAGANGDVVLDLGPLLKGNQITGTVDATDFLAALKVGEIYINVHTAANPGGEIRGQLTLDNNITFDTWLNGAQQVPSANNTGLGFAAISLSPEFDEITYRVITNNLSGNIGSSHLHNAVACETGDVLTDLSGGINGNQIMGTISGANVDAALINNLLTGAVYINVHTPGFPGGEIRGQVYRLARDGYGYDICTEQQTAGVDAPNASGGGMASIDRNLSNAHVMIVASGLTGDITGAHIHEGFSGTDGPVIYNMTSMFLNGGMFTYWSSDVVDMPFSSEIARSIQDENNYVNIHTDLHASGEIRGQIIKSLSCPFITGTQEIDPAALSISKVFPNPTSDQLNIEFFSNTTEDMELTIIDITGKVLHSESIRAFAGQSNQYSVDVNSFPTGVYFIDVKSNNYFTSYKFMIIE